MNKIRFTTGIIVFLLLSGNVVAKSPAGQVKKILSVTKARPGFYVVLGCDDDGSLGGELARTGKFLVHGLVLHERKLLPARQRIIAMKLYGTASIDVFTPPRLPYADELVNVLVVKNLPEMLAAGCTIEEILRVLAPRGVAMLSNGPETTGTASIHKALARINAAEFSDTRDEGQWVAVTKAPKTGTDEWTHERHGPDGNSISKDIHIRPSATLHWLYAPLFGPPMKRCLTAGGQNYYETLQDLVARDSHSGLLLWKREWTGHRSNSFTAHGDRLYAAVENTGILAAMDGATGKIVREYKEIIDTKRKTLVHAGGDIVFANAAGVAAVNRATGALRWRNKDITVTEGAIVLVLDDRVFIQSPHSDKVPMHVDCLDLTTGKKIWSVAYPDIRGELKLVQYGVLLTQQPKGIKPGQGVKEFKKLMRNKSKGKKKDLEESKGKTKDLKKSKGKSKDLEERMIQSALSAPHLFTIAYSVKDGKEMWQHEGTEAGQEIYAAQGLIWSVARLFDVLAMDPQTGKVQRRFKIPRHTGQFSFQCSQSGASTVRYILGGRPTAYMDMTTGKIDWRRVARNGCGGSPGLLLGNGMTYAFPKSCNCFSMLRGYSAFAVDKPIQVLPDNQRLERGPAYASARDAQPELNVDPADWPTHRGNPQRSASTTDSVALPLASIWSTGPEEQIAQAWLIDEWRKHPMRSGAASAPVISDNHVIVARPDSHRIIAFDSTTGKQQWTYTAGGRILTAPSLSAGLVLFGCQDGWVHCLRAKDGALCWRFMAAPAHKQIIAYGQLESHWPVPGGVLIQDGIAYFAAGRTSELEHRITGYAVSVHTGEMLWKTTPPDQEGRGHVFKVPGGACVSDIPVAVGDDQVQLAHPRWTVSKKTGENIESNTRNRLHGLRDGLIFRHPWSSQAPSNKTAPLFHYGTSTKLQANGHNLVFRDKAIYSYKRAPNSKDSKKYGSPQKGDIILATDLSGKKLWQTPLPDNVVIEAMLLAGNTLFVTGTRMAKDDTLTGALMAFSADDGTQQAVIDIAGHPNTASLAAAAGRLYLTTHDGKVLCIGGK